MKFFKTVIIAAAAIGIGIFLGTVPVLEGMTTADLLEEWLTSSSRKGIRKPQRIALKNGAEKGTHNSTTPPVRRPGPESPAARPAPTPQAVSSAPEVPREQQAPITAEAANSPEQTSASDKAALDALINKKSGK